MARPAGGPRKGRVELQPAVPGGSLRGWVYSRRGAAGAGGGHFPRVPGWSLPAHAGTALGHPRRRAHRPRAAGRGAWRAAIPATPPWTWARAGRPWGGFGRNTRPGVGGRRGEFPVGGPAESRLPPRPASSGFPIRRDRAGQRGRGRALSRSPPPAHKGRGLERGADAGGGAGGGGQTLRAPPSSRGQPLPAARGGAERPRPGGGGRTPRGDQRAPHSARERRPLGSANAPCAVGDPSLRPGTEDPLTGGRARGTGRGASLPQGWAHGAQGSARVGKTQIGQGVRGWHPGRGLNAA